MGLDETAIPVVAETPDMGNDLIGCADIVGIHRQQVQKLALSRCQPGRFAINTHRVMQRVDAELAAAKIHEYAFFGACLKLRGATGAPMRPVAMPLKS